jgi:hypothetical protein
VVQDGDGRGISAEQEHEPSRSTHHSSSAYLRLFASAEHMAILVTPAGLGLAPAVTCSDAAEVEASRLRTPPGPRKRLHELVCELGGLGHKTDVPARQLDQIPTEFPAQFHVHLVGRMAARFPPSHRHDPIGMRLEGVKIQVDRRILASSCSN